MFVKMNSFGQGCVGVFVPNVRILKGNRRCSYLHRKWSGLAEHGCGILFHTLSCCCLLHTKQTGCAYWVSKRWGSSALSGSHNRTDLSFAAFGEGGDEIKCHTKFACHLMFITQDLSALSALGCDFSLFMNLYIYLKRN